MLRFKLLIVLVNWNNVLCLIIRVPSYFGLQLFMLLINLSRGKPFGKTLRICTTTNKAHGVLLVTLTMLLRHMIGLGKPSD